MNIISHTLLSNVIGSMLKYADKLRTEICNRIHLGQFNVR